MTTTHKYKHKILAALGVAACLFASHIGRADNPPTITDEQVVQSMRKGIDYLLSVKKQDNWELQPWGGRSNGTMHGGETAIVLYTLLHAGESLQDDPDYRAKLHWRSKELNPVVQWLCKLTPEETYVASLQSCALALVPRKPDDKPGEGPTKALEYARHYLVSSMARQGGYSYGGPLPNFYEMWENYVVKSNKSPDVKRKIDDFLEGSREAFGGPQWILQNTAAELTQRLKQATAPAEIARIKTMMRELDALVKTMPSQKDAELGIAAAKKTYEDLVKRQKAGDKKVTDQDIANAKQNMTWLSKRSDKPQQYYPGDLSNGQYAALGAWALMDSGLEIPTAYWETTDRYWRGMQCDNGAWPYTLGTEEGKLPKDSMGVAGIATLFVCQEFIDTELRLVPKPDKNIDAGLKWLNASYKPGSTNYYYLYGVERVGLASGLKFFGTTNWYKEDAGNIVKSQKDNGSWTGSWGPEIDTCYALLFLARGRNPVCFNKLQYNGPWSARPRDDAYITRWMSKKFEKPINWQVVNLQVNPDEWLDAPVLLITGSADPKFTPEEVAKLKAYINAGGMIFSTADGNSSTFSNAMKKYAGEVVDKKYEMRQLPRDHTLFSKEIGVDLPNPPALQGISNGIREVWIHSSQDIGADWQLQRFAKKSSFELGSALYFYASGMASLRSKLQPLSVDNSTVAPSRTIALARIDYPGNSDPEPGAWARLAKIAKASFKTQVNISTVKFADLDVGKYPLAHLTGTTKFAFTPEDAQAVRKYCDAGGLLFIDAAGGNADFVASAKDLIKQAYPDDALAALPPDHPIYTGAIADSARIDSIDFRKFGNLRLQRRISIPSLEMLQSGNRIRILFSQWDICSGFLGTNTWGIIGYAPQSSEALGRNILLFAASQK
ncbi:MAG: DUF4159 domain-containing protein [Phycisphaerales bacterium]|nr:DUF4159 domain-containing protein [Phycisphaerales bacterium]